MKVALFFHIYQPPTQFPEITRQISQSSYERFTEALENSAHGKLTLNLAASLTKQLVKLGRGHLLEQWTNLVKEEKLELTGTAAYHPLLTKLPVEQVRRQVKLNERINRENLLWYKPRGFFPPEMVYDRQLAEIIEELGYEWVLLDESAHPLASVQADPQVVRDKLGLGKRIYQLPRSSVKVFFREREISLKVAFSEGLSVQEFKQLLSLGFGEEDYVILAMDGETFGHHHRDNLEFLSELMQAEAVELVTVSELLGQYPTAQIEPLTSTWGITLEEGENQSRTFPRWDNPANPVHKLQWQLFDLAMELGANSDAQELLDQAVHSDQFWWAGHNPCWHPGMVKRGAQMLKQVVETAENSTEEDRQRAQELYDQILRTGKELFGDEIVPC